MGVAEFIPQRLRERLGDTRAERLAELVQLIEGVLRRVYEMDAMDHDPGVGDNATLFGQKIWHHTWYALTHELEEWDDVRVTCERNSFRIHIWNLTIAVYKVGSTALDSIYDVNFDGSATKKADAKRNQEQMQLFSFEDVERSEPDHVFRLNDLWVAHFGSPREQLVKLYLGAPSLSLFDQKEWAWYRRVDTPGDAGGGARQPVQQSSGARDRSRA
jgi:hypothetical protein